MDNKQKNNTQRRSIFDIISEKIFSLLKNGMFGYFFTSYDEANKKYKNALKRKKSGAHSGKTKRKLSRLIENSFFVNAIPRMMETLLRLSLRDYGVIFFVMGALTSVLYPLREKILFVQISFQMFIIGIAICVCAIPLLFSSKSLAYNIYNSKLCDSLLFGFAGVNKERMRQTAEKSRITAPNITFFAGLFLGILSYIIPPLKVLEIIGIIILAYSVLRTPEIGVVSIILMVPFLSVEAMQVSILFVFLCYIFKCIVGKRTFKFEYFDLWVSIILVFTLIRGAISTNLRESLRISVLYCCLMLSYFLVTNLIRSKEWFRRCVIAIMMAGLFTSLIAIGQVIIGKISIYAPNIGRLFSFEQSAVASFLNPNVLAHFLSAILPFTLVNIISERRGKKKLYGFLICALSLVAMGFTHSISGIIGFVFAILLLLVIFNRNFAYLALAVGAMCPAFYFSLPKNALDKILSIKMLDGLSLSKMVAELREGFKLFLSNPFGIGFSEKVHSDSLFIQALIEYGLIGFIILIAFSLMLIRLTFSYCIKAKNQYRKINCCAGFCAVSGLIGAGFINYTWQDERLYLLFWLLVALSFAYIRIERYEENLKDSAISYTSATMDISLVGDSHHDNIPKRRYVRIPKAKEPQNVHIEIKEYEETSDSIVRITEFEEDTNGEDVESEL